MSTKICEKITNNHKLLKGDQICAPLEKLWFLGHFQTLIIRHSINTTFIVMFEGSLDRAWRAFYVGINLLMIAYIHKKLDTFNFLFS